MWAPEAVLAGPGSISVDVACGWCSTGKHVLGSVGDAQALCKHPARAVFDTSQLSQEEAGDKD